MNKPILSCHQLTKIYTEGPGRIPVLDEIDFTVDEGALIAIVGSSGSGKSTFLQILGGLDKPTSGTVYVADKNIHDLNETQKSRWRNLNLGFIYQFHHLLPEFNALDNICIPLLIRNMNPKVAKERALHYIENVGLINRQKHRIAELSGGERQRIAIARALVTEPKCVLADEPTGNLDPNTAQHIADLILQLNQKLKTSFVIATHNRDLAHQMHQTYLLNQQRLQIYPYE